MPTASVIVVTASNPSGIAAMASEMPISTMYSSSMPRSQPVTTMTAHNTSTMTSSARLSCASLPSNGVALSATSSMRAPMRPISVAGPVAVTTAVPRPSVTAVPRYTMLSRSPIGAFGSETGSVAFETATDSPVSAASSTCSVACSISRASAGTRSPAASNTRSPTTRSAAGISSCAPSRRTRAMETACLRRLSRAFAAFHSVRNPMRALSRITTRIAMASM